MLTRPGGRRPARPDCRGARRQPVDSAPSLHYARRMTAIEISAHGGPEVLRAVEKLSSKPIRHIIVTSDDADHTGGNEALSRAGRYVRLIDTFDPRGSRTEASIIAHENVLGRMSAPTGVTPTAPPGAWPTDTYFTDEWALFVNGEALQLLHVPAAHTDGDTMVFFRRSDVVATGDV